MIKFKMVMLGYNLVIFCYDNKMARLHTLCAWWEYKDNKRKVLDRDALQTCQRTRCKELGLIVFVFKLYKTQVEVI